MLLASVLAARPVNAGGYPTKPDEQDKLCEAMGAKRGLSGAKDRAWFRENCTCAGSFCGKFDSPRFAARLDAAAKAARRTQGRSTAPVRQEREAGAAPRP